MRCVAFGALALCLTLVVIAIKSSEAQQFESGPALDARLRRSAEIPSRMSADMPGLNSAPVPLARQRRSAAIPGIQDTPMIHVRRLARNAIQTSPRKLSPLQRKNLEDNMPLGKK